ncbi:MAG TPA: DNA polymerase III subunit alpha [Candidatus Binataceae bacterium]|nr:DNA polymerase III subunit alpha [Candidatus Binataceae bacterium]
MSFVHLHVHTQYSLLDGANKIAPLFEHVKSSGMPAIAMTDHGNMFGAVEFFQKARQNGVKPIIGCEAYLAPGKRSDRSQTQRGDDVEGGSNFHLILLAQSRAGYRNLCRLLTAAYQEGLYYKPRIDKEILAENSEGLIVLSGCLSGEVARALRGGRLDKAREAAEWYARTFPGRFYLELQDNALHGPLNEALREIGRTAGIPLVATNDCHYLHRDDAKAHEVLLCIQTGKTLADESRWRFDTDELYVKTPEEMIAAFGADSEEIRNTVAIANQVDFEFEFGKFHFPIFDPNYRDADAEVAAPTAPALSNDLDALLEERVRSGLAERLAELHARRGEFEDAAYAERIDRELPVIREMGFSGYMLIVADFIDYARGLGIPVGPGRGSVVGSLVSYALRITEVDPIEHKLLFERWLNPGRRSMPDIDVDFCFERRDEVLAYVRKKYGDDRVAQIITFGTIKGKQAIRDVGRVLGLSFAETDRIVKLYPAPKQGRDFPLADALEMEPRLKAEREKYRDLFDYAFKLEGLLRHASRHAAGVVIADAPLRDLVPLYVDKERHENPIAITQYSMKGVEEIGLIKFDFLALKNLTLIKDTLDLIAAGGAVPPDLNRLNLDDAESYKLIARGDTVGVFQLEGSGMRRFLSDLKPSCFEDVIAAISLFRPGTLDAGMVDPFIRRKQGKEPVEYDHPLLEPVLRDTYGVIIYQEQVMRAAQALAGYTLEEADILRAAMGKKSIAVMEKEREHFIAGAVKNGVDKAQAIAIFEKIATFASYGFNRSHAAAYALTSYTTAYLKAHFPREFMAALMSLDMDETDKTYKNIAALREMRVRVLPPDVNQSRVKFTVSGEAIRFGLGAIRGVGAKSGEEIIAVRERGGGEFKSLADFCLRVGAQLLNRRVLEALIKCGALDFIGIARAALAAQVDDALKLAQRAQDDAVKNQISLFGKSNEPPALMPRAAVAEWPQKELLEYEKETLGFYITAHPLDKYERELRRLGKLTTADLPNAPDGSKVQLAGVVQAVKLKNNKAGKRYATFSLEDREGVAECIVWPEAYQKYEAIISGNEPVVAKGKLDVGDERAQLILDELVPLNLALTEAVREVRIRAPRAQLVNGDLERLKDLLRRYRGQSITYLHLGLDDGNEAVFLLGDDYRIAPTEAFVAEISELLSADSVQLR